jgi:hypothetical protein
VTTVTYFYYLIFYVTSIPGNGNDFFTEGKKTKLGDGKGRYIVVEITKFVPGVECHNASVNYIGQISY